MAARAPHRLSMTLALGVLVGLSAFCIGDVGLRQASAAPPAADAVAPADLGTQIDAVLKKAGLLDPNSPVKVGISVVDLESGKTLYSHDADVALNPASNTKLVTTAAALHILGPEHRYATRIWAEGQPVDGVLQGKLYLQGGGDPSLVTGELYEMAGSLLAAGVTRIKGPIIVDAGRFDHDGLPPGFEQKDEFASHRAPGGAMSVNYNTYEVHVAAAKAAGGAPQLILEPPVADIVLENQAKTVAGKRNKLWFSTAEKGGKTVVTVHGDIGVEAPRTSYRYPVTDPSRYAGELLVLALKQRGIKIDKASVSTGDVPDDAELLVTFRSETLSELCRGVNKYSNNFMAEQILRTL
ncbi:MAG: D-alanyl-D-alanine carboxypeptidase/D-alanyl-D-alanine-endopeptidase, partial [Myxococcales bacterium]|nr:D-alanyl-D-alanine carboxypeptidase/D-alanyl-D-alanine-endopeptidase [Myxococcales bacterium]